MPIALPRPGAMCTLTAARPPRVAVGHRDGDRLLKRQHVADRGLAGQAVHQRQLGRARVAEHEGHAFLLEDLEERLLARDVCHGADDKPAAAVAPTWAVLPLWVSSLSCQ